MQLLFLITALNPNIRNKINDDLHGLTYLIETLDLLMKDNKTNEKYTVNKPRPFLLELFMLNLIRIVT